MLNERLYQHTLDNTLNIKTWYLYDQWILLNSLTICLLNIILNVWRYSTIVFFTMSFTMTISFVRPSKFSEPFQHFVKYRFAILIWNLEYAFGWWHHTSGLCFITIGLLWLAFQTKVGQIHFLHSWPPRLRLILQTWYIDLNLYSESL